MIQKGKINVLVSTSSFAEHDQSILEGLEEFNVIWNPYGRTLRGDEIRDLLVRYKVTGLIAGVEPLDRDTLAAARNLRVISRCGVGLDNIDLEAASELGIKVFTAPAGCAEAVAELTLGLVLDCLRKISLSDRMMRNGLWRETMGRLLKGKIFGIIGLGRIGRAVSKLVVAFDAEVIYYDLVKATDFPGVRYTELEEILRTADIVSLHLPLAKGDDYFVDANRISLMKEGAILINTSRGALVDEDTLYDALKSGRLSAAGIDVFEEEPYSGKLTELDNVVLTCHMGSCALESRILMERQAVNNLLKGLQ